MSDEIVEVLEYVKETLSGPAREGFEALVRHEFTVAAVSVGVGAFFLLVALVGFGLAGKWYRDEEARVPLEGRGAPDYNTPDHGAAGALATAAAFAVFVGMIIAIPQIGDLVVPEAAAIKTLMGELR